MTPSAPPVGSRQNRRVSDDYADTAAFRGAKFNRADLSGARFRDCDLTGVKIVSSLVEGLRVDGFDGRAGRVIVDDVDVTEFVQAELDRRYPERARLRSVQTAEDYRAAWELLDRLWSDTIRRADSLPESLRHERVDDEWSFVETLRHLVFGVDVWVGRMILDEQFHPLGLAPSDLPAAEAGDLGIDLAATPSFDEIVAVHASARERVRSLLAGVTDARLAEIHTAVPAPAWGEESHSVAECLGVVFNEHCEHRRFAVRDLAVLESR